MDKYIHDLFNDEILVSLIKYYDLTLKDILKVGGFENYIYGYKRDSNDYILRISHSSHRSLDMVKAELDFINYLAMNNANVSTPVLSNQGNFVEKEKDREGGYFTISSYTKARGIPPKKDHIKDVFLYNYGKTVGMFHRLTKDYHESNGVKKRFNWDRDPLIVNARRYLPAEDDLIYEKFITLINEIKEIPQNRDNFGLIHTDIHFGNFFVEDNNLTVFDFDDCCYFYFVSDIAIALFYYLYFVEENRDKVGRDFLNKFMKGYLSENPLNREDYQLIDKFLKLREIILYIVVLRSCDLTTDKWGQKYYQFYRHRILNDIPFVNL